MEQMSIFDDVLINKVIDKPVRLISFFSGIEAQYKALSFIGKELNIPVESYKTCEWAYNSIIACNSIHNRDFTDYSLGKTKEELLAYLQGNISTDYNVPADLTKKSEEWLRKCYNNCIANHNLMNIMNVHGKDLGIIDNSKYEYIASYSFPCQDLSLAGKRAGMSVSQAEGGTRSGLLWEFERIITECKQLGYEHMPNILLMENVPQIHSEKDYPNFEKWMLRLEQLGYTNYWKDVNAKNYGIPQNRERTFMISILRNKDGDEYNYKFPQPFQRQYNLKDFLENEVDEKYYLSSKMIDYLTGVNQKESKYDRGSVFNRNFDPNKNCAATITTAAGQRPTDNFVVERFNNKALNETIENVELEDGEMKDIQQLDTRCDCLGVAVVPLKRGYDCEVKEEQEIKDTAPTLTTQCDSTTSSSTVLSTEDTIKIQNNTKLGYLEAHEGDGINISSRMKHQRGNVQNGMAQTLQTSCEVGVVVNNNTNSLFTDDGNVHRYIGSNQIDKLEEDGMATTTFPNRPVVKQNLRIRKLTPKEAMRLMAFQDCDVDRISEVGLANASIYHCAGDSICVNVLIGLMSKLFGKSNDETEQIIKKYIETIKEK